MKFAITLLMFCFVGHLEAQVKCNESDRLERGDEPPGCYLCDDSFRGSTEGFSPDLQPYEFNLGEIENSQWVTIETGRNTFLDILFFVQECQNAKGIEVALYDEAFNLITEEKSTNNFSESFRIFATDLLPQRKYQLMVDGIDGDLCKFLFYVEGKVEFALADPNNPIRALNGTEFCLSATACFKINEIAATNRYFWSFPNFCKIESGGGVEDLEICLSFTRNGGGTIRLEALDLCDNRVRKSLNFLVAPLQTIHQIELCPDDFANHDYRDTCYVTASGCDSCVFFEVEQIFGRNFTMTETICEEACFQLGDSCFSNSGRNTFVFEEAIAGGCDSVVTVLLTVENIMPSVPIRCVDGGSGIWFGWESVFGVDNYLVTINRDSTISTTDNSIFIENISIGSVVYVKVQPQGVCTYLPAEITCFKSTSSVESDKIENEIVVFPNPTTGQISIETDLEIEGVEIYDIAAQLIQKENVKSFSIQNKSEGIYFLKIKTQKGIAVKRILVQ